MALLCVITPEHTALTVRNQPKFYWFLRKLTSYPIELTLIEENAIYPVLETRLQSPAQPGIQKIQLADYKVHLQPGLVYKWFIAIVPDSERRSKDIIAWGAVQYIKISDELKSKFSQFDKEKRFYVYAAAGIWYDAFSEISTLLEISPSDYRIKQLRDGFLEQVGLAEITKY